MTAGAAWVWFAPDDADEGHTDVDPVERPLTERQEVAPLPLAVQARPPADEVWRAVDERSAGALPPFDETWSRERRVLVDVSAAVSAAPTWRVGDKLALDLPQLGQRFESAIERITEGADGSRSFRGMIVEDDGLARRWVVTVGPTRVFAYVDTSLGSYELIADSRTGWLLPTSSLLAGWDFGETDVVLPEPEWTVPDDR